MNDFNSGSLLSHISGSQKSQVRVLGGLVPSEATTGESVPLALVCCCHLWHPRLLEASAPKLPSSSHGVLPQCLSELSLPYLQDSCCIGLGL